MVKKRLKIAIFHCGFIYSGGGERIVLEEAMGLEKRGYEVVVRAPTLDRDKCYPDLIDKMDLSTFFPKILPKFKFRYAVQMVATSVMAPILSFWYRDVDVFVGANQPGIWVAYCMSKVLKKPYVIYMNQPNRFLYPREVDQENGWVNEKSYAVLAQLLWIFSGLIKPLEHASVKNALVKMVNGSYIGGMIEGIYHIKTKENPAGAHPQPKRDLLELGEVFRGKITIGKQAIKRPYILLTNRHDPQKKFEYVIEAMRQVKKKFPKVSLVIPGPYTAHTPVLLKLAKKLKVDKQVMFLGQISEAELQKLYRNAAVYVYPSPQEDFGMGPLEAGAWGVPTVAWNNAGPTVTVEDGVTGFLATPFEVRDYGEKIIWLLEDPRLQYQMGQAAWERVKKEFSWKKHVDILEKTIKQVI